MARPPRHRIELSAEERSELERIARAEKRPWREVQRARIVLYAAEGRSDKSGNVTPASSSETFQIRSASAWLRAGL
jgi:hypothetical protein